MGIATGSLRRRRAHTAQVIDPIVGQRKQGFVRQAPELLPHADSDKIRLVAVGTPQRIPVAPDLPTVAESFPGFEFSSWNGFSVPAGTPEEIITAIRTEITALAKSPALQERLTKLGIVPGGLTKDETAAVFRKDKENFATSVKAAGIAPPQ